LGVFYDVNKPPDEVDRVNAKRDLRPSFAGIFVAFNSDQAASLKAFKHGDRVAVGYVAGGDNLPAR
jgi:hypothetical protein